MLAKGKDLTIVLPGTPDQSSVSRKYTHHLQHFSCQRGLSYHLLGFLLWCICIIEPFISKPGISGRTELIPNLVLWMRRSLLFRSYKDHKKSKKAKVLIITLRPVFVSMFSLKIFLIGLFCSRSIVCFNCFHFPCNSSFIAHQPILGTGRPRVEHGVKHSFVLTHYDTAATFIPISYMVLRSLIFHSSYLVQFDLLRYQVFVSAPHQQHLQYISQSCLY